eukprot:CAMPEP_0197471998 /NCGR_PEP_ID=MMETSP1309-20131121/3086_1 /TAXON_ID=464262 /ORGANISM="Genus nov. species nov., Strain RCC998" /LENGTH=169 /DNA_ID=CAMNT_0043010195 /DNA_START=220 /DNA_END=729 /DNA_ORIENTATION=-
MHDENKVRATRLAKGSWMDALLCVKGYEFQTKSTSASSTNERPATGRQLVDLSNFDMNTSDQKTKPITIKCSDMSKDAVSFAIEVASNAIRVLGKEDQRGIAKVLKEEFDKMLNPAWQCIVGQHFGSFITHAEGTFVYFLVEDLAILLFRTIPAAASKTSLLDTPKLKV